MGAGDVGEVDLPDDTHAEVGQAAAGAGEIVELEDGHVSAVSAPALEIAARGGAGPDGGDDLKEGVAHRHHRVLEPELGHARVAEGLAQPQLAAQRALHRFETLSHQGHLAEPDAHGAGQ